MLKNHKYETDSQLGNRKLVGAAFVEQCSASDALVLFVSRSYVSYADLRLNTPSWGQYPMVTVTDTGPVHPAFVSVVFKFPVETEGEKWVCHIELTANAVQCEKVSVE